MPSFAYDCDVPYDMHVVYDGGAWGRPQPGRQTYVLLIDIGASTRRNYAKLDQASLGAQLELQTGAMVVTFDTDGASLSRNARGSIEVSSGKVYFEFVVYGTLALAGNVAVGILPTATASTDWPGNASGSYGYLPGDGEVWANGSSVGSVAEGGAKQVIGMALDADANTLDVYLSGLLLHSFSITGGATWVPAVSVGGATAYELSVFCNFGRRAFELTPPEGYDAGLSELAGNQNTYRISGGITAPGAPGLDYLSWSTDDPANTRWRGCIKNAKSFFIERSIGFWPDGDRQSFLASDVTVNIPAELGADGRWVHDTSLDGLITDPPRDAEVIVRLARLDRPLLEAVRVGTMIFDRAEQITRGQMRIKFRDPLARLERPLQRKLFLPYAAEGAANRPWPITLGACRNVEPVLYATFPEQPVDDTYSVTYAIHDAPLTQIAVVRDRGDPLEPSIDYAPNDDLSGIFLENKPEGKLTADTSSTGEVAIEPGVDDVLAGIGEFDTWAAGPDSSDSPDGWDVPAGQSLGSDTGGQINEGAGPWVNSAFMQSRQEGAGFIVPTTGTPLEVGKTYRWTLTVIALLRPLDAINGYQGGLGLTTFSASGSQLLHSAAGVLAFVTAPGVYTGLYTVPAGSDRPVYLQLSRSINDYAHGGTIYARFDDIRFEELAAFEEQPLEGITLTQYMREILETRAGEDASAWSSADTEAIDAAAPYPFGVHLREVTTVATAVKTPLPSFAAAPWVDADGVIRFARLVAPEDVSDDDVAFAFSSANYVDPLSTPVPRLNEAPGLTTNAGVRRNWSVFQNADFVDDYDPVTGIDSATRARFRRESQYLVGSSVDLHPVYSGATDAGAIVFLFDQAAHGQLELDRVDGVYEPARNDYALQAYYPEGEPPEVDPGSVVTADGDRWDLAADKKLLCQRVRVYPLAFILDTTGLG